MRIGWTLKRQSGTSHRILARPGWSDVLFAYHDRVALGPTSNEDLGQEDRADAGGPLAVAVCAARPHCRT
ncbi:MAG: type II toxin-antitoxin system HicA family toxin [Candidatus Sulfopaludibacter sp.]|nr:type II toxin-antitoxin system HicA family toxin [Candidatus Sulfopaludibacter sp.]